MVDAKTHAEVVVCTVKDAGHRWSSNMKVKKDGKDSEMENKRNTWLQTDAAFS